MSTSALLSRFHGRPAASAPRWARWAAYATPLVVLPSGLWRVLSVDLRLPLMHAPTDGHPPPPWFGAEWWYVIALSVVAEGLAFLAIGLVSEWGEVWPRWIPGLGGRPVPVLAAVLPAGLGAAFNTLLWPYSMAMISTGHRITGESDPGPYLDGWQSAVFYTAYWPLAAWGPLLGLLTVHYFRRRRGTRKNTGGKE
ncbi:hypothetical protein ACGFX4_11805 [Kitasatospora sp. NPDC048365]|uniref:hypothetical protein n=1 Tax=Kitasatospora sp. NPDC048365 TaxID=3364050 RepID=UPI003716E059